MWRARSTATWRPMPLDVPMTRATAEPSRDILGIPGLGGGAFIETATLAQGVWSRWGGGGVRDNKEPAAAAGRKGLSPMPKVSFFKTVLHSGTAFAGRPVS